MTVLSVNLNKIALLRNSREGQYPNPVDFANAAIESGSQGITVHPRPDQRHIRPGDVISLSDLCKDTKNIEFNIEGNPFAGPQGSYPGFMSLVEETRPDQCTLVPDTDEQLTSDHGFDLTKSGEKLKPIISQLKELGIRISLFMDPDIEQIGLAAQLGVERIELYTGPYADEYKLKAPSLEKTWQTYKDAACHAQSLGLAVNAGHDLNLENLGKFLEIPDIKEVSIGHALTVDALLMGFDRAVAAYAKICK